MFLVFVYGSLRAAESNHEQMAGARLVSSLSVALDAALIVYLEGYPGLVRAPGARTVGEVYEVDSEQLARLDAFEGCPDQYVRQSVQLEDGRTVLAYFASEAEGNARFAEEEWPRTRQARPRPTWFKE